jgi:signal transduction histidine kinase/ActR/RegA family two-component response regulator
MQPLYALFDDRFEEVSRVTARGFGARVASAVLTSVLMALAVSPAVAAGWATVFVCLEVWNFLVMRPFAERPGTPAERLHLGFVAIGAVCVWTAMAVIYWLTGSPVLQFVSVCVLMTILLSAQTQSARSLPMLVIVTVPPVLALSILSIFFSGFQGLGLLMVCLSLVMLVAHLVTGATMHRQAAANLERLQHEAVAANQAKSAFLAMMSHEIRTPMNGVLGMAHALAQSPLNAEQRRQVDMLTRSGDGLMTILNDILDLSKIEAGKFDIEETVFDLHDVVFSVQDLWSASVQDKGLVLISEIEPSVPQWVTGDPTRVRQILLNHVSNAVKFTERGEIRISVAAGGSDEVLISIRDTGIGLTAEQCDGLFEAFSQADASTTRRFGGTGLGLSISKQLVGLMGGDIAVDSVPGAGTEFRITLPLPAAPAPASRSRANDWGTSLAGLRILVAEDNPVNKAVVQAILAALDAEVHHANDGEDALRLLRAGDYDLVLMDIHMPVMDGIEALRRIRSGEAGRADQPVIALTADAMAGDGERFIALGFDAAESKPIQPPALIATISRVCAGRLPVLQDTPLRAAARP